MSKELTSVQEPRVVFNKQYLWRAMRRCILRCLQWEFWPMHLFYSPVYVYYLWLALRARSLFFFSSVNPRIWFGGLWGESKWQTYVMLPKEYMPFTYFFPASASVSEVWKLMQTQRLSYPIVLKPDVGQRGRRVRKISDDKALTEYIASNKEHFILQAYVDYPLEVGVFYYRLPKHSTGVVSSLVIKKPLLLRGDGTSTVKQLMQHHYRASHYISYIEKVNARLLYTKPKEKEAVVISSIGSHSRGATFLDGRKYITSKLSAFFDRLSKRIPDFYYGRFDIRCRSFTDLAKGKHFKILELNGVGAEAAHIYDPRSRLLQAYKDVFHHFHVFYQIARMNNQRGIPYPSWREGMHFIRLLMRRSTED